MPNTETPTFKAGDSAIVRHGLRNGKTNEYEVIVEAIDGDRAVVRTPKGKTMRRRLSVLRPVA